MRQILSISLPSGATKEVKKISAKRGFPTVSNYIAHLIAQDKELISEAELLSNVECARKEYRRGTTTTASSLADLL